MYRFSLSAGLLACLALLLLGCGGAASPNEYSGVAADSAFMLPAPAELHLASAEGGSPFRYGAEYVAGLPNDRINPGAGELVFWPATNIDTGEIEPAYAMYLIDLPGYDHEPVVRLETESQAFNAWIGFANFTVNRWDWQQLDGVTTPHYQNAFDPAVHVQDGKVLAAIVAMDAVTVEWLVAGDTTKLYTTDVQPKIMETGTQAQFAAEFMYSAADTYAWNFGGGVTPPVSTEPAPTVTVLAPGTYSGTLEVTNALSTDTYDFSYEVVAVQAISPMHLLALPDAASISVGEPVRLTISCGRFPVQEQMASCQVCLLVSDHASYVADSFNLGKLGGEKFGIDGIWAKLHDPPTDWIPTPDAWFGAVEADEAGMVWMMFGSAAIGAGETLDGGDIYSLEVTFDAPGQYAISFAPLDEVRRTRFSDGHDEYYWYDITNDAAPMITVTE